MYNFQNMKAKNQMTDHQYQKLVRADRDLITGIVPTGSYVLDLGCGDGSLLSELKVKKGVDGRGIDIDENNLIECVEKGLSVCQSDLDNGLDDYPDDSYDYVILNQTLQVIRKPEKVIREMLRVGRFGIVGFPNFGQWRLRSGLLFRGRMPKSPSLPFEWYNTPNIHQLTIKDFRDFCLSRNISIIHEEYLIGGTWRNSKLWRSAANICALNGMFVITDSTK